MVTAVQMDSEMHIGLGKKTRRAYGFDEIALVPGSKTVDMELCDISYTLGGIKFQNPIIASAMDSVVDSHVAGVLGKLGGLGVLNLQGVQTRYKDLDDVYKKMPSATKTALWK
jgi:IMP dehydrogenase/GMP reductase